jgi:glyoxylase-like metal-dependent hydrolase (beta-lactamase superfamily II)
MNDVQALTQNVRRITAPNPGPMTGAGTNTYILGRDRFVVVDPGPAIDSHIEAILKQVDGRLEAILVTHTHSDHSPAAAKLAARTLAPRYGLVSSNIALQDATFTPDVLLKHNELLKFSDCNLRAIHTPGHVDNHFCFMVEGGVAEDNGMLLAGDHIMNGSTVVIMPPQGDMAQYIESLRRLATYPLSVIAPAHGELMPEPLKVLDYLIAHRLGREQKVLDSLATSEQASKRINIKDLVQIVYSDVDSRLHPIACYSLLAHLLKLESEQKVRRFELPHNNSPRDNQSIAQQDYWQLCLQPSASG